MVESSREAEKRKADLVELRLDFLDDLSSASIKQTFTELMDIRIPKIATIMPSTIFGKFNGSDETRARLLLDAADYADYVDLGSEIAPRILQGSLFELKVKKAQPIISWHSQRPLNVAEIVDFVKSVYGRAICKVVMTAENYDDNLAALQACSSLGGFKRIVFCHGEKGAISRVLAPFFGSEWSYASLGKGKEGAPGQLDQAEMRRLQEAFR